MSKEPATRPSLVRTITWRLAVTALVAILLQIALVIARAYLDEDDLNRSYVTREAQRLVRLIRTASGAGELRLAAVPSHYRGKNAGSYAFRVLNSEGSVVGASGGSRISDLSPWRMRPSRTQDFWLLDLDTERKLFVAGGLRQKIGGQDVWFEVATWGDPDAVYLSILAAEVLDDVWILLVPMVVLMATVAIVSIRRALRGLIVAARQAERLSPLDTASRFDVGGMPKEAASLAIAINGLLDRVASLVKAQRLFFARAAHELRTPLAVMMLELGRVGDERARRLETDVHNMSETVDRLLTLARLESSSGPEQAEIDLGRLARDIADRLREWAARDGHVIEVRVAEPCLMYGDVMAIREAIRNLVDNAVKHTPARTGVRVNVGPGARVIVEDDGPGLVAERVSELLQPFKKGKDASEGAGLGLSIVRHAVDLHKGGLSVTPSASGGARFELDFTDATYPAELNAERGAA
ncbi:MAG: HAMP domain-containing sensor histidine kinase [Hyphomicrobiaceae bacterium]|nr:HAMP domain-containing sensor histidine kinase [Hyphomicrobiaceae bacterium]